MCGPGAYPNDEQTDCLCHYEGMIWNAELNTCNCIEGLYDNGHKCTTCVEGCHVSLDDIFSCDCSEIENVHWVSASNTYTCNDDVYNESSSNTCKYCPADSTLNANHNGCNCIGFLREWLPYVNTCECVKNSYLN